MNDPAVHSRVLAGSPMRGRGWIKALRQDEARQVRARIAELERDLIAPTPQGRHRRFEAGHELRCEVPPGASQGMHLRNTGET
ncbi:hypothetical protein MESS2_1000042 [Mesorhizobium metallidurans STM 2683]|uniref:Uncharacterized protein n=1 Tax=Mesorhizobium metallidurans STM 2683 TaxID=1297569 RepID=M5EFR2_9HYPH|nr:hypothetical protein MESS2_1000042 [Mesorhizobium metallidurans STM 2683]